MKLFAATAVAAFLATAPALAEDAALPATSPAATGTTLVVTHATFITVPDTSDWLASRLMGSSVYSPANENLGKITDVVANDDGQVKAVVIGVGGFLGIGEKNVAVAPGALLRVADGDSWKYQLDTTKDALSAAPEFKAPKTPTLDKPIAGSKTSSP